MLSCWTQSNARREFAETNRSDAGFCSLDEWPDWSYMHFTGAPSAAVQYVQPAPVLDSASGDTGKLTVEPLSKDKELFAQFVFEQLRVSSEKRRISMD